MCVAVGEDAIALDHCIAAHIEPAALGQPGAAAGLAIGSGRSHNRSHENIVAKHILVFEEVGIVGLGPLVVEGTAEAHTRVVGLTGSGIDVRHQRIAQSDGFEQQGEVLVFPDAALYAGPVGGMGAEDGCEHAILHPSQINLGIVAAGLLVAAQVVSPIAESHIRCRGGEVRLPGQCAVGGERVAREAYRITVAAESSPAVEDERTMVGTVQAHVVVEHVVAPECLRQSLHIFAGEVLLPVNPPEVHSLLLAGTDDGVEHIVIELGVAQIPGHHLRRGVEPHGVAQFGEIVLVVVNTVGRMEVERHLQSLLVHPVDESLGVGNGGAVPGPAGPALRVPVHIEYHHVHGYLVALHIVHNLHELVAGVTLVFAVPVAQHVERRHGLTASHLDEVAKGFLILMTVTQEIPVDGILVHRLGHPLYAVAVAVEGKGGGTVTPACEGRLVDDGPSGS